MKLKTKLLAACFLLYHAPLLAQCVTAPAFPACTGTEPLVIASDNIAISQTKYFYGAPASVANVKLSGGILVVCGELTLTDFVFDSGTIFIQPGAALIVSNGAGLIVKGNTSIYNAGRFQCLGNYVMDGTNATTTKPNIFVNVLSDSRLEMQNQYFVINNPYSRITNNGIADFHGLITDPLAAPGCVCLGLNSQTRMTVLHNKAKHPYISPNGPACVSVGQYSQFYDTLTVFPDIHVCLSPLHNSDASCIPWGCKPNAWGGAQVSTGCTSCASVLTFLALDLKNIEATAYTGYTEIKWQASHPNQGYFYVQRSDDGINFQTMDSVKGGDKTQYKARDYSLRFTSYYRVVYYRSNQIVSSNTVQVTRSKGINSVYPNPFSNYLIIPVAGRKPGMPLIKITDISGKEIRPNKTVLKDNAVTLYFDKIAKGIYLVTVTWEKGQQVYKVVKE